MARRGLTPFAWKVNASSRREKRSIVTRSPSLVHAHTRLLLADIYLASAAFRDPHTQREAECLGEPRRGRITPPAGDEGGVLLLLLRDPRLRDDRDTPAPFRQVGWYSGIITVKATRYARNIMGSLRVF